MELHKPPQVVDVKNTAGRWVATFTQNASTVTLSGPVRTFTEPGVKPEVTHNVWVRTLPAPFAGTIDKTWLNFALSANRRGAPDVLSMGMQYILDAPPLREAGLQIAGDASYGPLVDGKRKEGADFNDYLGIPWNYPDAVDKPEARQFQCLDCSGLVRMILGFRRNLPGKRYPGTIPLCLKPRKDRRALPRRAFEMLQSGPGVLVIPNAGTQVKNFSHLRIGDLVFFDADPEDGTQIDHVGIYLGLDTGKHYRFLSSRKQADGPTMGDFGGKSILDGNRLYAKSFRAVRRV